VASALLGPRVHFLATFLIDEGDGHVLGENKEEGVSGLDLLFGCCPEDDSGQEDDFCFARNWSLRVLAGAHSKKEAGNGDVCYYGGGRVKEGIGGKACGLEQVSQQLGGDGF
jgi:hypothetical protein